MSLNLTTNFQIFVKGNVDTHTHTNIMSLVALYLALLPSVHCTCAPRELFTPRDLAGSSIVADGVWVPGIRVPGVLGNMQNSTLGQNLCWDPQMHKKNVSNLLCQLAIYIYIRIYTLLWHDQMSNMTVRKRDFVFHFFRILHLDTYGF